MARKPDSHHVLPLWCDDLIASCVDMTPACFGAYMRLLCYAWTRGSIPDDEAACSRIAGGMGPGDWAAIRDRLVELDRGKLTHQRLELERLAVAALKEKRAESGRQGGRPKANGKQNESKTEANGKQNESKTKAPTPTPTPTPCPDLGRENTTRHWGEAGLGLDEWERFVGVWNRTDRAKPWTPLLPPDGWIDHAASPGWLSKAHDAMSRLPACEWFTQPVAVTRFFDYVDRIIAGEFDTAKHDGSKRRQPAGGNL
jgi:uncharacterized protein YdaU (DUF1376 family)